MRSTSEINRLTLAERCKKILAGLRSASTIDRSKVMSGQGLEQVIKHGWPQFRAVLARSSYAEIIESQLAGITRLGPPRARFDDPADRLEVLLQATALYNEFAEKYPQAGDHPVGIKRDGKLELRGKTVKDNASFLTKFYFAIPVRHAPAVFRCLFDALKTNDVLKDIVFSLNFRALNCLDIYETNVIIIYAFGKDPRLLKNICEAIQLARSSRPEIWEPPRPGDLALAKSWMLAEFLIPLCDNVAFVELEANLSWDDHFLPRLRSELLGGNAFKNLNQLAEFLKKWTPEKPGEFTWTPRKYHMPPLLSLPH